MRNMRPVIGALYIDYMGLFVYVCVYNMWKSIVCAMHMPNARNGNALCWRWMVRRSPGKVESRERRTCGEICVNPQRWFCDGSRRSFTMNITTRFGRQHRKRKNVAHLFDDKTPIFRFTPNSTLRRRPYRLVNTKPFIGAIFAQSVDRGLLSTKTKRCAKHIARVPLCFLLSYYAQRIDHMAARIVDRSLQLTEPSGFFFGMIASLLFGIYIYI